MVKKEESTRTHKYKLTDGRTAISKVVSNLDYLRVMLLIEGTNTGIKLDLSRADWKVLDTRVRRVFRLSDGQLKLFERYFKTKKRKNEQADDICKRYRATVNKKLWYE